jgi:PmbA protein
MLDARTREILLEVRSGAEKRGLRASLALHREQSHLMRIGNNSVSLNTSENLTRLDVRVVDGRREGTHTRMGEIVTRGDVEEALEIAVVKSGVATPKDYDPILAEVEEDVDQESQFDPALASLDPAVKAGVYSEVIEGAGNAFNFSGSWSSGVTELYLVSTAGPREAHHKSTDQLFTVVLKHPDQKWELHNEQTGWKAGDVSPAPALAHFRSYGELYARERGVRTEPGEYTVILGPSALAELAAMAVWTGCGGRMYEEKMAWTTGFGIGDSVLGSDITIVDDPASDLTFMYGFDMGGKRRRRFPLFEQGRLAGLTYDMNTAARYGRKPTGHEIEPSLVIGPGSGPESALEAARGRGRVLYIPALHYMNLPNASKGIFTGSSRFSAVALDDGAVSAPMFSTRITDSFQNIFGNVAAISPVPVSVNGSNTYGRRSPVATSSPSYALVEKVKITDCAESF